MFLELYNSSNEVLSLKGWTLVRYTNSSTEVSSTIELSEYSIDANGLIVISPNALEFKNVYGFSPTISGGTNSPADSNGDDNIALIELVKNSKDAGSPSVQISFQISTDSNTREEFSELLIYDNGKGMSKDDIVNKWLNIAYSQKKH